jgi:hypothetical protein
MRVKVESVSYRAGFLKRFEAIGWHEKTCAFFPYRKKAQVIWP